jgi:hypothetical protein
MGNFRKVINFSENFGGICDYLLKFPGILKKLKTPQNFNVMQYGKHS